MQETDEIEQGLMTVVYDSNRPKLRSVLLVIQHEFNEIIRASFDSRLNDKHSVEVIVLRGNGSRFQPLTERLISQKGVMSVELRPLQAG
ncbi:MAG: putative nickel-responsive regulator [Methanoregula sp. PtaU1.Bin051]|nr:MAG: putative nickel-responsive regulator [Methanoregula sp. PtaU1.Bin051]